MSLKPGDEIDRAVEIKKVSMVQNGEDWDAHVTIGTSNPDITLGIFVMKELHKSEDFAKRFEKEAHQFLEDDLIDKQFCMTH